MKIIKKLSKKIIILFLSILIVVPTCVFTACSKDDEVDICSTYSTLKVMQEQKEFEKFDASIEVYAAKGETESGQIIITPKKDVKSVTVSLSDLKSENGAVYSKANVDVLWQKYIKVEQKTSKNENEYYPIGMYPDMLLPFDIAEQYGENIIVGGLNQGITFDFSVPEDLETGVYTGNFEVVVDGKETVIPVSLNVWDFCLEKANGFTVFQIWQTTMMYGELNNTDKKYKKYFDTLLNDYKTCPQYLPNAGNGAQAFVDSVKEYWDNKNFTTINIPTFGDATDHSFVEPEFKNYIRALADECTPDTIYFDKAVVYLTTVDEPHGEQAVNAVKRITTKIKEICLDVYKELLEDNFFDDFGGTTGTFAQELKESMESIQIVVTAQTIEGYGDAIDTCCPYISVYETEYDGEILREHGNGNWMYTCMEPVYPYPSHHIDDYLIGGRILRWIQKANDIEGYLYWGVSEYYNQGLGTMIDSYEDSVRWSDGLTRVNGDGFLIYPGFKYGSDVPFGSLRALTLRDGQEDYDTLCLLENILRELKTFYDDESICLDNVVSDLYDKILQNAVYNSDDKTFDLVRKEVADTILRAKNQKIIVTDARKSANEFTYSIYAPVGSEITIDASKVNGVVSGQGLRFDIDVNDGKTVSTIEVKIGEEKIVFEKQLKGELLTAVDFSDVRTKDISVTKNSVISTEDGNLFATLKGYEKGKDPTLIERSLTITMPSLPIAFCEIENLYLTVVNCSNEDVIMTITTDNDIQLEKIKLKANSSKDICIKKIYDISSEHMQYAGGLNFYFNNAYIVDKYVEDGIEKNYRFYSDVQLKFENIYYTERQGA